MERVLSELLRIAARSYLKPTFYTRDCASPCTLAPVRKIAPWFSNLGTSKACPANDAWSVQTGSVPLALPAVNGLKHLLHGRRGIENSVLEPGDVRSQRTFYRRTRSLRSGACLSAVTAFMGGVASAFKRLRGELQNGWLVLLRGDFRAIHQRAHAPVQMWLAWPERSDH